MRRSTDFQAVVRHGARVNRTTLVIHCLAVPDRTGSRVGMVVARTVGGAVTRNKVRRRLRGVVIDQRSDLPEGIDVVIRALPPSAGASYAELAADLTSALPIAMTRARGRLHGRPGAGQALKAGR